jgi:protein TonB
MMSARARIWLALTTSLVLHLALLAWRMPAPAPTPPMRLEARLMVPENPPMPEENPAPAPDILEKNTIAPDTPAPPRTAPSPAVPDARPGRLKAAEEQQAVRKLSEHVLYPQSAVEAGHEGTVHLLLKLDTTGRILHASVAAGSGHPELDHAALQAALRAGRLNGGGRSELILPITFRLQ